jgi:hypothetical protein
MPLKGRVGRHTKLQGRHCQNWTDDQSTVIGLLNSIPDAQGGPGDSLIGSRIVNGIASDALYRAIVRFEDKHFPGQRSGFVDPGGAMLKRMEELARKPDRPSRYQPDPDALPPPPKWNLDVIHRELLYRLPSSIREPLENGGKFHAEGKDALFVMAARQVKSLKDQNFTELPWPAAMFGRAYVLKSFKMLPYAKDDGSVSFSNVDTQETETPNLPIMRYGEPVDAVAVP